jgi:PAS domain S-box-containing protein
MTIGKLDSHVLGQLLLMQNVLINLPGKDSIFSFVCEGLIDVPGIEKVQYFERTSQSKLLEDNVKSLPITLENSYFGEIEIKLSNPKLFEPYKDYVYNFVFMIGVILEERHQREVIDQHKKQLEEKINDRTKELNLEKNNLFESQRRFTDLMKNVNLLSVMLDIKGNIFFCNKYFLRVTNYRVQEVMGKNWFDLFIPNDKRKLVKQIFLKGIEGKGLQNNLENEILTKSGKKLIISWNNTILRDVDKRISGTASIGENITQRKKAEKDLIKKNKEYKVLNNEYSLVNKDLSNSLEKLLRTNILLEHAKEKAEESDRLKTAFLHNISHEIRTPLNSIMGFSDFLKDQNLPPDKLKLYSELIIQSSHQLLSIITDIVHIATIEAGQESINEGIVNINKLCELIYQQYRFKIDKKNIRFNMYVELSDIEAIILSDETKITEILSNLIGNSAKFTLHGEINFGYRVDDEFLEFIVEDTGIGIPKEMHEIIFSRFRQVETEAHLQYGGSGLGLSISKAYVELLGGKIWLESEPGKGSKFYFTIPYKKSVAQTQPDVEVFCNDRPITILVAEDEDSNFLLIKEILRHLKTKIYRAANGIEAIEISKSNPDIDLILMDLKMPKMDGLEATEQIKEILPDVPIIAQSAYHTDADKQKALAYGCSDYISKPLNKEQVLCAIKDNLIK